MFFQRVPEYVDCWAAFYGEGFITKWIWGIERKKEKKNGKQQTEGKKEGGRWKGGVEERRLRRREGKEKSEGENKFAPGFYLNLLIRSKACPKDMLLSFSGWALQWNSCVGGISTCDSCFMWEMNLPVMWETVGNEQAVLRCDLTLKSGRIMAHKALEWDGARALLLMCWLGNHWAWWNVAVAVRAD